jgi:hypothetical protein
VLEQVELLSEGTSLVIGVVSGVNSHRADLLLAADVGGVRRECSGHRAACSSCEYLSPARSACIDLDQCSRNAGLAKRAKLFVAAF